MDKIIQQLRKDFEEFGDFCSGIIIFGSLAEGKQTKRSDVDVCIVRPSEGTLNRIYSKLGGKYDIKVFEKLPLYLKMEVMEKGRILYGNKVNLSEYFYFYRKFWKDMEHRIIENEFEDVEERRKYRRKWMNEKEKILGKTGNL